ncbi:hypothetical protein ANN_01493 [Periplaneta americana]|uniref:Histone-lysine N-methyltransferase SETMAR n=1 Tax=Periplaneta americana TaxID=6978 RepID=A0ABQ8TTP9_PERAM|nr:hypothetical protein ANN_01493 [Periplaneta americana]
MFSFVNKSTSRTVSCAQRVKHIMMFTTNEVSGGLESNILNYLADGSFTDTCHDRIFAFPRDNPPFNFHDNAPCHVAEAVAELLRRWDWEVLEHPPYSPDVSPCDYDLFPRLKEPIRSKRFADIASVLHAVGQSIREIYRNNLANGIQRWSRQKKRKFAPLLPPVSYTPGGAWQVPACNQESLQRCQMSCSVFPKWIILNIHRLLPTIQHHNKQIQLLFNDAVSTTRLFSVDEIGDSEMVFGEMRPRIRHRLPGIHLKVGENLGKNPTRKVQSSGLQIAYNNPDDRTASGNANANDFGKNGQFKNWKL